MFDVIGQAGKLRRRAVRRLPVFGGRRRLHPAAVSTPVVAVAGLAAAAGLLLWDERRRSAMRRRMEQVAGSVSTSVSSSLNRIAQTDRVAPRTPVGAGRD